MVLCFVKLIDGLQTEHVLFGERTMKTYWNEEKRVLTGLLITIASSIFFIIAMTVVRVVTPASSDAWLLASYGVGLFGPLIGLVVIYWGSSKPS